MGILQLERTSVGEVGVLPGSVKLVTTDNLSAVTTAGYLDNRVNDVQVSPSDIIEALYLFDQQTGAGTFAYFTVAVSNGIVTLSVWVNPGSSVLLPVVSGDVAVFNGTSGQIKDSGASLSDTAKTKIVMATGAVTINHIATFTDTAGTVGQNASTAINSGNIQAGVSGTAGTVRSFPAGASSGALIWAAATNASGNFNTTVSNATAVAQSQVVSIPDSGNAVGRFLVGATATPFTSGNFPVASGTGGLMVDSGLAAANIQNKTNIIAATTADIGGSGAGPVSVVVAGLTAASVIVAGVKSSSNPVSVIACIATGTGFNITFSADPGVSAIVNYVAFIVAQ